jgi:hypothetical protein
VSGQLHIPVALSLGKAPPDPIGRWVGTGASLDAVAKRNMPVPPGIEPRLSIPLTELYLLTEALE